MKNYKHLLLILLGIFVSHLTYAQTLPDSIFADIPGGTFTMGEPESDYKGPPGSFDAPEHEVTLSDFRISTTEITNAQYVSFLNSAYSDGLLIVETSTDRGPDEGFLLVYGSDNAPDVYKGLAILNLSGTRVMKDHNNDDGDNDPFTGEIEPENPLNLSYVGFSESNPDGEKFYVKDPRNADHFDWQELTNYYDYTSTTHEDDTSELLNDYDAWAQLEDYPNNLPTHTDVKTWPATFIRWYGAKAFAMYYSVDIPTEAQWEYVARGGSDFENATSDGEVNGDGTSANWNHAHEEPALHHVYDVKLNDPNPYGVYNMGGNVWEWCEDWYSADFYEDGVTDPVNMDASSNKKVRRGGSWNYHETTLKSASRFEDEQFKGNDHFGFRIVDNSTTTNLEYGNNNPSEYRLENNYPNPFNPSTEISYSIPEAGFVTLTVTNLLGQHVATLVNGQKSAGTFTVSFDASDLASGVYLYTIEAGHFRQTQKMLLIK